MTLLLLACASQSRGVESPPPAAAPEVATEAEHHDSTGLLFVGATACAGCHAEEMRVWRESPHATARESLTEQRRAFDPDCLECHVTGLLKPGGFHPADPRDDLAGVTCESCHGAASAHLVSTSIPPGSTSVAQNEEAPSMESEQCERCHNRERSPDFHRERYWESIAH